MPGYSYRAKRLKKNKPSFLGKSFIVSLVLNILLLYVFGNMVVFDLKIPLPEKEELTLVTLIELPAPQEPKTPQPEVAAKQPVAQLQVSQKTEPVSPEPPKLREEVTDTKVVKKEELKAGVPKVEVETPPIESTPQLSTPPAQARESLGEDISVSTEFFKQSIASRKEVKGEILDAGESQMKIDLGERGVENIEATYGTVINPGEITALPETKEKKSPFGRRPLSITIENSEGARPQSGLDKANIVYEMLTEGGITRFLAVYYDKEAEVIGPVRSARPYFISKSLEHQSVYVHAGGSEEAYNFLRMEKIDDINEFVNFQPFRRSKERTPPHNLYTSTVELRKEANKLGYMEMVPKEDYQFETDSQEKLTGKPANSIVIPYNQRYVVSYKYQPESMKYLRFINNEPHIDAQTKEQLVVDNIVIQFANTKVTDEEGRLAIDLVGEGKGLVFFKGGSQEIVWKKQDLKARTVFLDKEGNRIAFTPGNVWIQIVPSDLEVKY